MSAIAIRVDGLSKQYLINRGGRPPDTLRDQLVHWTRSLVQPRGGASRGKRTVWALRDVSLEVKRGEALGIIGPNGAGKSTFFKVLSRITEPTRGRAEVYGRLGALLEVGTGFHPELTGRENLYLSGAILGMKRMEIARRFDEIVAFSGVEKFLDTPVKQYSSGMYVRLAFAVAVHLEPDVILIDEVLSVGDLAFQAKCQRRLREVARGGATILFVSHNLGAVGSLCDRAIVLQEGSVAYDGPADAAIRKYFEGVEGNQRFDHGSSVELRSVELTDESRQPSRTFESGRPFGVRLRFVAREPVQRLAIGIWLRGTDGQLVFHTSTERMGVNAVDLGPSQEVCAEFDMVANLCAGSYALGVVAKRYDMERNYLIIEPAATVEVAGVDESGGAAWLKPRARMVGAGNNGGSGRHFEGS